VSRQKLAALILVAATVALWSCGGNKSAETNPAPAEYKVRLQTSKGDVLILVHRDWSPNGADRFYQLTKAGFYDGNRFFRVLRGFIVQWGLNGDPRVNKEWNDRPIKDDPPKVSNKIGTVVFAMAGPNSRTTQVFANLGDNSTSLDPQGFTPFGEVIQGMETITTFYMDYGDGPPNGNGPTQESIAMLGNAYLQEHFPKLDYIKTARVVP
jgi:peptidyl-prolyl cis-trans isomerase A (cyclophilin A)